MNTHDDKDLFNHLYIKYIHVADKYLGGFCVFSTLVAIWAYARGQIELRSVFLVGMFPVYHLFISRVLRRYLQESGLKGTLLLRILPNTFATPYVFYTIDPRLTPWWGIYLCMALSSIVAMGYRFAKPYPAYAMTVFWALNLLAGKFFFDSSISPYQIAFLAAAIIMVGMSSAEWIHQARSTIQREAEQSAELKLVIERLLDTETKLKESLEKEALVRQSLQDRQHLLQQAQRISKIGFVILDTSTGAWEWSSELRQMLRVPAESPSPSFEQTIERVHPDDREMLERLFKSALNHSQSIEFEHLIQAYDDSWLTVRVMFESERDTTGNVIKLFVVIHDVSQKVQNDKIIEEQRSQLISSSRLSSLGQMASGIAHEINTPLDAIHLNARLLNKKNNEKSEPDADVQKRSDAILAIGQRIAKIIRGLKHFSRHAEGEDYQKIAAETLVEETLDLCRERCLQYGVELRLPTIGNDVRFYGDAIQSSQVLLNLLNNAFDAVQGFATKWIELSWRYEGETAEIAVVDSGSGVKSADIDQIFNPFYTTKNVGEGMGLGLSIGLGIMKKHGGDLIYDKTSQHTRFVMIFPKLAFQSEKEST